MIIFDLDGTLADCEHRRHFVDPSKRDDCYFHFPSTLTQAEGWYYKDRFKMCEPPRPMKFEPDWKDFYEECDKDEPIKHVIKIYNSIGSTYGRESKMYIWSGRCESVKEKTLKWIYNNVEITFLESRLIMRPLGDNTPDDQLKERWLDEVLAEGKTIDCVFDDRKKVVEMWIRRGIFVFDVSQGKGDF